ncbi:MAG: hypothetical protein QOE13_2750 [Gaiellaceae bacterium]|jgi:hypothetical protein|nr:hypothetical protein [Gaiellaceae bacterium]
MRYDVYLIDKGAERRVSLDIDIELKRSDKFPYQQELYEVKSVQRGPDGFDATLFAVPAKVQDIH